jgi:asparagine synthase (glutamine-hydrolysing)
MCGIAGVLDPGWRGTTDDLESLAVGMATTLAHRGPDDEGSWCDPEAGLAFGHRRLSVIDLSRAGHQPMLSADGRWVATYNGECYNASELRASLPGGGRGLRGHCDTEVVLEAVAAWGVRPALQRINGMFALALWDRQDRTLHLVRDRVGEKPLYYAVVGRTIVFGSELRAIAVHPAFKADIDRQALAQLLRLNYIPAPRTIYSSVRKLAAGTMISMTAGETGWPQPETWWDFTAIAEKAVMARPASPDAASAHRDGRAVADLSGPLTELGGLLSDAVARRLVADVGVGSFLSGGIDSSLVTALAQAGSTTPVRTFTVGFAGEGQDEVGPAAAVARHLGTDHTEVHLTGGDALAAVPDLPRWWDEPFADPSQLPTILVCRQARRHVTVALSGDGGDEVFGGYRRYTAGARFSGSFLRVPQPLRRAGATATRAVPPTAWRGVETAARRLAPAHAPTDLGNRATKLARLLPSASTKDVYASLVSGWDDADLLVLDEAARPVGRWAGPPCLPWSATPTDAMMAWDTMTTLPDEMLVKVDRASSAVSLEVRVPYLDHRVVEAAWALPPALRIDGGTGKRALRMLLDRYVPRHLVERPKSGFDPPIGPWLRGPLRPWAEDLLSESRLRAQGLLDPVPIRSRWDAHLAGRPGQDYGLWAVLVFQAWLDEHTRGRS